MTNEKNNLYNKIITALNTPVSVISKELYHNIVKTLTTPIYIISKKDKTSDTDNAQGSLEDFIGSMDNETGTDSNMNFNHKNTLAEYVILEGTNVPQELLKKFMLSKEIQVEIGEKNLSLGGDVLIASEVIARRDISGELYSFEDKEYVPKGWTIQQITKKIKKYK